MEGEKKCKTSNACRLKIIFSRVKVQDGISYKKLVELTINFFSSNQNVQEKLESKMKEDSKVIL